MKKILFAFISFLFSFNYILAVNPSPTINVTDADFGDVIIPNNSTKEITIANIGNSDLIITGYQQPSDPVYEIINLPALSVSNPLVLHPNNSFIFEVTFTPLVEKIYKDQIIFFSNTNTTDGIAILNGKGIKKTLESNGYDWGHRLIDLPGDCPSGPYCNNEAIHIYNSGTQDVVIYDLKIETDHNSEAFEFDRNKLINLTIPAKGDILIPVCFHPTKVGIHELTFSYDNSAGSTTKTTLKGIGVFPKLETNDVFFDSTIIQDYTNPSFPKQKIFFTNLHWNYIDDLGRKDSTDVSDSTTIDFKIGPNGDEISSDGINWGIEGFRFDKTKIRHSRLGDNLTFPVVVYPGDSLEIVGAQFIAQHAGGIHKATITIVSDGCDDVTSTWTGRGIDPTAVEDNVIEENNAKLLGYYDILGRRINSIEQYHGLYLEIRMEKNKVLKKIVYKD